MGFQGRSTPAEHATERARWPFASTDAGPAGPAVVDLDGVLVVLLVDDAAGAHAYRTLTDLDVDPDRLRLFWSVQVVVHEEERRRDRARTADERTETADYAEAGRAGCSALWVLAPTRPEVERVVQALADQRTKLVRYHRAGLVETLTAG